MEQQTNCDLFFQEWVQDLLLLTFLIGHQDRLACFIRHEDRYRIGLMKSAGLREGQPVQSDHIAYQLAPRLNAVGRLSTAQDALSLLLTDKREEAEALAEKLEQLNRERRDIEQQVLREAAAQLQGWDFLNSRSIVVAGEGWNPGVVGLTAGKLAERWNYPCIVLTDTGEGLSGSGRSVSGVAGGQPAGLHPAL